MVKRTSCAIEDPASNLLPKVMVMVFEVTVMVLQVTVMVLLAEVMLVKILRATSFLKGLLWR
jgi:hypothetical protein